MATAPSSNRGESGEPPRKRVRKGTKSCWECKRRKIRCQLSTEDVSVCSGCKARGSTCVSQEYPEEHDTPGGTQVGERLGRVELLLEKLVATIARYEEEEEAAKIATPESMGSNDVLTPYTSSIIPNINNINGPLLSLFDNEMIGRGETTSQITTPSNETPGRRTAASCRMSKVDRLRQALVDLLPSQHDVDIICAESSCWLLIRALNMLASDEMDTVNKLPPMDTHFNVAEISHQHPTIIAKTLVYLAIGLQQLPASFDPTRLHVGSIDLRMNRYMSSVQSLIASDDELVSTIEGLECLVLQGIFHMNGGNPRRAWLSFRRALNIGQMMGIHKHNNVRRGGKQMWHQIMQADLYFALLLGLPAGSTENNNFRPDENFDNPKMDKGRLFCRKLCSIASRIIDRNQAENRHAYTTTQEISEQLENLASEVPPSWWSIPRNMVDDMSVEATREFDNVIVQIWFYQLEAVLHLPFMLRAAAERKYDYSKFTCLKASREMIYRYLAIRWDNRSFCCKIIDFSALTATVTLLLGLYDPAAPNDSSETRQQRDSDHELVQSVLRSMEQMSVGGKDVVASQCVDVIKTLLDAYSPSSTASGNLRLTIPYFGTIDIVRPTSTSTPGDMTPRLATPLPNMPEQHPLLQTWQTSPLQPQPQHLKTKPMVSFISSQFPPAIQEPMMPPDWQISEADTLYFDSLLNTDIEGNWIFT